jgi:hypothetical protein
LGDARNLSIMELEELQLSPDSPARSEDTGVRRLDIQWAIARIEHAHLTNQADYSALALHTHSEGVESSDKDRRGRKAVKVNAVIAEEGSNEEQYNHFVREALALLVDSTRRADDTERIVALKKSLANKGLAICSSCGLIKEATLCEKLCPVVAKNDISKKALAEHIMQRCKQPSSQDARRYAQFPLNKLQRNREYKIKWLDDFIGSFFPSFIKEITISQALASYHHDGEDLVKGIGDDRDRA